MANFNKVILIGNLTRDAQLRTLPNSQNSVTEFGIAVNRRWKSQGGEDREEVCFVDCTAWGRTGEVINERLRKGDPILIEGRLKYDTWEDKQGGGKRSKLSVVVESFQFLPRGQQGGEGQPRQGGRPAAGEDRDFDDVPF